MANPKFLKDDLRYLVFSEIYLRFSEPKTLRRAFAILESAIDCFDKKGFGYVTLTMIARQAGVTRQSVNHYFKDLAEIRETAIKYIRLIGQNVVVNAIKEGVRSDLVLKHYI